MGHDGYTLPAERELPLAKHAMHAGAVIAMAVLEAEGLLVTMSDDGVMMLTNLTIARGKTALPRPPPLEGAPVCLQRITDIQVIAF